MNALVSTDTFVNDLHVHLLENKNFKTVTVELKFQTLLDRSTITERTLLSGILRAGCSKFPTARSMQNELDDLYGASLNIFPSVAGNSHILTVQMEFANERFIDDEHNLAANVFSFMNELLFHPKTEDSGFDKQTVVQEKEKLKKVLKARIDDKTAYSDMRLMDEMAADERYSIHTSGYLEDLDTITAQSLLAAYHSLLVSARIDLFIAGDVDAKTTKKLIETKLTDVPDAQSPRLTEGKALPSEVKAVQSVKTICETDDIQQAKLHIGYRTEKTFKDKDFEALMVGSVLLGGHAGSLLFTTVREEHSLAYYVGADLDLYSDKLIIFCGIAPEDYSKTVEIIDEQVSILKAGTFSDEVMEDTKAMLIGSYQTALDSIAGIIATEYQKVLTGTGKSPQQMVETFKTITREDIQRAICKLAKDTTYFLTSKEVN